MPETCDHLRPELLSQTEAENCTRVRNGTVSPLYGSGPLSGDKRR